MNAEERKAKIKDSNKVYREIEKATPLYLKYKEKYEKEASSNELAKQKKALEDKRNFIPGGGFKRALGEHQITYKLKKDELEQ